VTRTLIVRAEAEADLAASRLWYEEQHKGLGASFIAEVDATFRRVEANPAAFAFVRSKLRRALVQRFPFGVFYVLTEQHIVVVAVLHAARDPRLWGKRQGAAR
jgi:plasmid stabilization system protein ParE